MTILIDAIKQKRQSVRPGKAEQYIPQNTFHAYEEVEEFKRMSKYRCSASLSYKSGLMFGIISFKERSANFEAEPPTNVLASSSDPLNPKIPSIGPFICGVIVPDPSRTGNACLVVPFGGDSGFLLLCAMVNYSFDGYPGYGTQAYCDLMVLLSIGPFRQSKVGIVVTDILDVNFPYQAILLFAVSVIQISS